MTERDWKAERREAEIAFEIERGAMAATKAGRPRIGLEVRRALRMRVEPRHLEALKSHNLTPAEVVAAVAEYIVAANKETRLARLHAALDIN